MTNEEINAAISGWFEPKPTEPLAYTSTSLMSPKGIWRWEFERGWQGSDYFTDESANARLLEAMSKRNAYVWIEWDINEWCVMWKQTTSEDEDPSIEYNHRDRKTVVVMAFLKFAGINP